MIGQLDTHLSLPNGERGERMVLELRAETVDLWLKGLHYVAVVDRPRLREALHQSFAILQFNGTIWAMISPNSTITYPGGPTQLVDPKFFLSLRGRI